MEATIVKVDDYSVDLNGLKVRTRGIGVDYHRQKDGEVLANVFQEDYKYSSLEGKFRLHKKELSAHILSMEELQLLAKAEVCYCWYRRQPSRNPQKERDPENPYQITTVRVYNRLNLLRGFVTDLFKGTQNALLSAKIERMYRWGPQLNPLPLEEV